MLTDLKSVSYWFNFDRREALFQLSRNQGVTKIRSSFFYGKI